MHSPIGFAVVAAGALLQLANSMLSANALDAPPKIYPAPEAVKVISEDEETRIRVEDPKQITRVENQS